MKQAKKWILKNIELLFWIAALTALFFLRVDIPQTSLCFFSLIGLQECPGCGIGHAIHYALRFDFEASFHHHVMGIPGVIIIFIRIKQLLYKPKNAYETKSC